MLLAAGVLLVGAGSEELEFTDVEEQTALFMRYFEEIELTEEQTAVMTDALLPLAAPCCSDRSALTCCCKCNMARSWWGLSKHLIAERGYDVEQVRAKVSEWFEFIHPNGAAGDSCYKGRCSLPFKDDGCGGMSPARVAF